MSFRIRGLDPAPFRHLFGLPDEELLGLNVKRAVADRKPGFPDRVELSDVEPGESLLLLNYLHSGGHALSGEPRHLRSRGGRGGV